MKYIIDILLIAIFAVFAIIGVKCGFIKLAAKPIKFVLALVLAFSLCSTVSENIVTPIIDEPVTGYVSDFLVENCKDLTGENLEEELPTLIKLAAQAANVDIGNGLAGDDVITAIADELLDPIVGLISGILAFVAVYLISKVLLWLIFGLINSMFKRGIFGALNRTLGLIFAGFFGLIVSWGIAVIIELVIHVPALETVPMITEFASDGGFIYNFFNTHTPMELLLSF